jgi:hypothetical protein
MRPLTDKQVEEARRVIANQASTIPADGDIGPTGAVKRVGQLIDVTGRPREIPHAGGLGLTKQARKFWEKGR